MKILENSKFIPALKKELSHLSEHDDEKIEEKERRSWKRGHSTGAFEYRMGLRANVFRIVQL
ncbi:MAG: hypothetical protein HY929_08065 [Euryarchaeota archaeon]|nr:hypothetical protein [Euryarchaeota archaeon]